MFFNKKKWVIEGRKENQNRHKAIEQKKEHFIESSFGIRSVKKN